jgi:hypothetical protein
LALRGYISITYARLNIIASVAFFEERRWGKWHEFGAAEALIEPLVHLGFGGAIQYGTIA